MARISNDDDSWKAGGVRRRDFRHSHEGPEVPRKTKSKKKDTKRWCRGKPGREHNVHRVQIVDFNDKCKTGERCGHWRHYETKCINCGMVLYNLPKEARAQVDSALKRQMELEEKYCSEGHLMDWESNLNGYPEFEELSEFKWFGSPGRYLEYKVCAMCGKRGRSRRRAR